MWSTGISTERINKMLQPLWRNAHRPLKRPQSYQWPKHPTTGYCSGNNRMYSNRQSSQQKAMEPRGGILLSDEKARATDKHYGRGAPHTQNAERKKPGSGCTLSNFTAVKLGNANESTVTENRPAFPRARAI